MLVACLLACLLAPALACPWACSCRPAAADCAHRALLHAPRRVPTNAQRLDLQGNNITIIFQSDFQNLKELKTLQLSENQIHTIERDAFLELTSLERLDLSRNELTAITRRAFRGLTALKSLHLDGNQLKCIDEKALENLKSLEVLTLTNNNLTALSLEPAAAARLHTLRLADNPVVCDCRAARLATALRAAQGKGVGARCVAPAALRGSLLTELEPHELICSGPTNTAPAECSAEPRCPPPCRCSPEGTVDCREKLLTELPHTIPHRATEIRLEQNEITEVGPAAFAAVKRVARIDLSNNKIAKLAADAFSGLAHLTSLVLYGNKIKDLPSGIFHGLSSLQLLLLNSNEITCVRKDTFRDLQNLKLLSLYDNNIRTIPNGTFDALTGIQTLHLGRNPFECSCSLRWLAAYLRAHPVETSGARCDTPKRQARKRLDALREDGFKCKPTDDVPTACGADAACPAQCACEAGAARAVRVACERAGLAEVPRDLPLNVDVLLMADNNLGQIKSDGLFGRLPDLTKLDLRNNGITAIEDNAFDGAASIQELLLDGNLLQTVTDKMFFGLHSLSTLSLTNNKIRCITPGAFDHLTMLSTLSLSTNPLSCTCHIAWLPPWLRARRLAPLASCASPPGLQGAVLQRLEGSDMRCTADDKGCLPAAYCPSRCACAGTVVRCSRAALPALPADLPRQTTELYLESNEITSIAPEQIRQLTQLTRLDLSNNRISVLSNNTFEGLTKLSTLIVNYNRLRCVQRDALKGLTQLRVLSLHGNNISMLADGVFRDLESISHVALGSNPLHCDCSLRWLSRWARAHEYAEPGIARCSGPAAMRDKLVLGTADAAFVCLGPAPPDVVSKCDRCYSNPCANGGQCSPTTSGGFHCRCARGYHGETCQHQIDACYGSPCANGQCQLLEEGRFHCACQPGYTGVRCEANIDDCAAHRCQHNATCVDRLEGYSCQCAPGYMGEFCEKKIPFCTAEFNPCANGAACTDHTSHYSCACPKGYSGENCTVNADDCVNHMCQNGASCIDGLDEYRCECAAGYAGRYCEAAPHAALGTSPCAHHDCVHGVCYLPVAGLALQDDIMMERPLLAPANDYLCKCAPGYSGRLCEYLTSLTFSHNDSLVELEPLRTAPHANVTLVFSTTQHHGVLMYFGAEEHLAAELFNGRVRISYDVGNHPTSTMYSFEMVSDGAYHKAELLAVKKNFTLRVDDGPARSIINEGAKEFLRLERPMYLGGVPEEVAKDAFSKWHLRNITSFKGCLKEAWINNKRVDFANAVRLRRAAAGCGEDEPPAPQPPPQLQEDGRHAPDPCVPNPCARGGRCVREEGSLSDYTCRCPPGTAGAQCESRASIGGAPVIPNKKTSQRKQLFSNVQASPAAPANKPTATEAAPRNACRKEATRQFITEGQCRSRRAVRGARCRPAPAPAAPAGAPARGCPARQCCGPRNTKRRKIRLVCADGTRYTKEVEIVRKCGCTKKCAAHSPFLR